MSVRRSSFALATSVCLSVCPSWSSLSPSVCVHCKWQLRWSNKQRAEPREEEQGGMRKKSLKGVLVKENRKVTKFDVARANETFAWWIELLTNERTNERTSEPSSKTDENCVYSVMLQVAGLPTPPLYPLNTPYLAPCLGKVEECVRHWLSCVLLAQVKGDLMWTPLSARELSWNGCQEIGVEGDMNTPFLCWLVISFYSKKVFILKRVLPFELKQYFHAKFTKHKLQTNINEII